jgi:hypothetical protein
VLVSGEAGAGKTALLRHFSEERDRSVRVLWGGCDPLFTPSPLGPLFVIAEYAGGELEEVVQRGVLPHEVVAALARELQALAPTVLVLEDLHWGDEATLDVLRLLARRIETVPAVIVASYRNDELTRSHPLRIVVGELATNQAVSRLRLAPLSPAAVAQLAEPHGVDSDELYRKTVGNPFFVVEALAAQGDEVPGTVSDAIFARTARLSGSARQLLEAASIVQGPAELWLLEALAGGAIDGLDDCVTSGMLMHVPAGVAFRHELARLAVEESVALHRRVELHRKAVEALADPPGGAPDLARLAYHAEAAGDADAVVRVAPAAAAGAASLGAHREAAAQYARALRFGDALSPAARARGFSRTGLASASSPISTTTASRRSNGRSRSAARWATGSRKATRSVGSQSSTGARAGRRNPTDAPALRSRCLKVCRPAASSAGRTPTSRSTALVQRAGMKRSPGASARSNLRGVSTRPRSRSTRSQRSARVPTFGSSSKPSSWPCARDSATRPARSSYRS